MNGKFDPAQAIEVARAFAKHGVDYLFIGKSGAILLGYPSTTQDVDIFAPKDRTNGAHLVAALRDSGFAISEEVELAIVGGKDFVQIKSGPFDIDVIHAPDGIESFAEAKSRSVTTADGFPVTSISDIIRSKKATGRAKDKMEIPLLEDFEREYCRLHSKPLLSAEEIVRTSLKSLRRGEEEEPPPTV